MMSVPGRSGAGPCTVVRVGSCSFCEAADLAAPLGATGAGVHAASSVVLANTNAARTSSARRLRAAVSTALLDDKEYGCRSAAAWRWIEDSHLRRPSFGERRGRQPHLQLGWIHERSGVILPFEPHHGVLQTSIATDRQLEVAAARTYRHRCDVLDLRCRIAQAVRALHRPFCSK